MSYWFWKLRVNVIAEWWGLPWGVASWDEPAARDAFENGDTPNDYLQEFLGRE